MTTRDDTARPRAGLAAWIGAAGPPLILVIILQAGYGLAVAGQVAPLQTWRVVVTILLFFFDAVGRRLVNDYEDFARGLDTPENVRPASSLDAALDMRLVRRVGLASFAIAWVLALWLALTIQPWIVLLTVFCYVAYFLYAGGRRPLGHRGMGEAIDLVVTGFSVTLLIVLANVGRIDAAGALACTGPGFLFSALMLHNNARDTTKDALVGKTTLPQLVGQRITTRIYIADIALFYVVISLYAGILGTPAVLLPLLTLPWAVRMMVAFYRSPRLGDELVSWAGLYFLMIADFALFIVGSLLS